MPWQFQARTIVPLFLLVVCGAQADPISLPVQGGSVAIFAGSASTVIAASGPATILITETSGGSGLTCSPPAQDCPGVMASLDFAPLSGGQGVTDPAHASWSATAYGTFFQEPTGYCGGAFGIEPFSFSCTETVGPGLYSFNVSLSFETGTSSPVTGSASFEGTLTLISGGPIAEAPEPESPMLCATGMGLLIGMGIMRRRSRSDENSQA